MNKNLNILIVTPFHPMAIAESLWLYDYENNNVNVFSPQSMALLAEETLGTKFLPQSLAYTKAIARKPSLCIEARKTNIVFGTIEKSTQIKWDYILYFCPLYLDKQPDYLIKIEDKTILPQFYTKDDAEYSFNEVRHLSLFLETLGLEKTNKETTNDDNKTK